MLIADDVVVNPAEVPMVPARTEKSLSAMGLSIIGADWGESVSGQGGSLPRTRIVSLRLAVREDDEADLPTAAHELQQVVGTMQERETWIRRDPKVGGPFAGSLLFRIRASQPGAEPQVTLADFAGWQVGDSPDVVLTMVADFAGLSTEEDESEEVKATTTRERTYTLPASNGTAKGLKRVRVKNEGAADWRGLIWAEECWDAPEELSDPTAQLAYLAKNLTPKGGAAVATVSGAEVVQHSALTAGWLAILNSKIAASGHMTHRGPRRMWMRIYDPGAEAGGVQLRLLWRALGSSRWSENQIVSTYVVGDYSLIDLGECRPQVAALGDERWEWQLMTCAPSGSGAIRIRDVYPLPTEQYLKLSTPYAAQAAEHASSKTPGTVEDHGGIGTLEWKNYENAKTSDNTYAEVSTSEDAATHYLLAKKLGFAIPEGATITGIIASIERHNGGSDSSKWWVEDASVKLVKAGAVTGSNRALLGRWPSSDAIASYGKASDLWGTSWTVAQVNAEGFGVAIAANANGSGGSAKPMIDAITVTVYYTEAEDENRVCFATRSLELRSNGVYRQAPEDDVWGIMVPDGFLPYSAPGGREGRQARGILIPSRGDLEVLPDSGTPNPLSAVVLDRAGYPYAREGA